VERLPSYAPDLNPVEWLRCHLEEVELRSLSCLDLEQFFHRALGRRRWKPRLMRSFFEGAGLAA
jgi:transposase